MAGAAGFALPLWAGNCESRLQATIWQFKNGKSA